MPSEQAVLRPSLQPLVESRLLRLVRKGVGRNMSRFGCAAAGCDRHPAKGDTIIRISPKGEPFQGLCEEHIDKSVVLSGGSR